MYVFVASVDCKSNYTYVFHLYMLTCILFSAHICTTTSAPRPVVAVLLVSHSWQCNFATFTIYTGSYPLRDETLAMDQGLKLASQGHRKLHSVGNFMGVWFPSSGSRKSEIAANYCLLLRQFNLRRRLYSLLTSRVWGDRATSQAES